jgi:hypothetical protein
MKAFVLGAVGSLAVIGAFVFGSKVDRIAHKGAMVPAYVLHEFRPKTLVGGIAGVEENQLIKMDVRTGEAWRLEENDVPLGIILDNGRNATQRVVGWERVPADYDLALQEVWRQFSAPAPPPRLSSADPQVKVPTTSAKPTSR